MGSRGVGAQDERDRRDRLQGGEFGDDRADVARPEGEIDQRDVWPDHVE